MCWEPEPTLLPVRSPVWLCTGLWQKALHALFFKRKNTVPTRKRSMNICRSKWTWLAVWMHLESSSQVNCCLDTVYLGFLMLLFLFCLLSRGIFDISGFRGILNGSSHGGNEKYRHFRETYTVFITSCIHYKGVSEEEGEQVLHWNKKTTNRCKR